VIEVNIEQELWAYDDPHESGGSVHITMTRKQAVDWMRRVDGRVYGWDDDKAFEEWKAVNWAYREESSYLSRVRERLIKAAVEEDRKTRPHTFVGRTDRYCELCNEPDRADIHIANREFLRNRLKLDAEEEREAILQIIWDVWMARHNHPTPLTECDICNLVQAIREAIRAQSKGEKRDLD
jgi:hypothetical protein